MATTRRDQQPDDSTVRSCRFTPILQFVPQNHYAISEMPGSVANQPIMCRVVFRNPCHWVIFHFHHYGHDSELPRPLGASIRSCILLFTRMKCYCNEICQNRSFACVDSSHSTEQRVY